MVLSTPRTPRSLPRPAAAGASLIATESRHA
jgi:hypothetical protein